MKWSSPPIIKIYEALGCIADDRIKIDGLKAKVYSSSKNKFYDVIYEPKSNSIMCNDNGSFYIGYLGYPSIAYLMKIERLGFSEKYSIALKNIYWKDLNMKYNKNKDETIPNYDFNSVINEINLLLQKKRINLIEFHEFLKKVLEQIKLENLNLFGEKKFPPKEY